ncbi:hypothetical protein DV735_g3950, partial [Chaetothyriales sp. CBS 134920]
MSPSPQLAAPGSSTYNSRTMHVGDGTWDAGRDTFLLPNLVGLNFATMRYNGMGNRFFTMAGYQSLVKAHGILAAVTFLGAVPLSIFIIRFYGGRKTLASRLHIWLNILALLLTTVVFILGFIAVGPRRSLTNPHHGIGVAIYVLVWAQMLQGCIFHRKDMHIRRFSRPLKVLLHAWLGRALALLAITQVALGLTLYGSPLYLFVLYALYLFGLLVLWFIFTWLVERRKAQFEGSEGSYFSVEPVSGRPEKKHGNLGAMAMAGAAGLGAAALWNRHKSKSKRPTRFDGSESGTGTATSYLSEEKYSEADAHHKGWGHRLLQIGALAGGVAAVKKVFGRHDTRPESRPYRPALGGNQSVVDSASLSQVEEGLPPVRPTTPTGASPGPRPSHPLAQPPITPGRSSSDSYSYYSYMSGSPSRQERKGNTFRNALAAGGAAFAFRQVFKKRRQRKEEQRAEKLRVERLEQERIQRMHSVHKYSGDGTAPPRRHRPPRMGSQTASDVSDIMSDHVGAPIAGVAGGVAGAAAGATATAAAVGALADRDRIRPVGSDPRVNIPTPPTAVPADVPPVPPPHLSELGSSSGELATAASGRQRQRQRLEEAAAAGAVGATLGASATDATRRRRTSQNVDSGESPPKKKRLLNGGDSDEHPGGAILVSAAAVAEKAETSLYPTPPPPGSQQQIDPRIAYNLPPPPPIPGSMSNLGPAGSITSPGTETSAAASEYANNRRRRRAERAKAHLARNTVEFS